MEVNETRYNSELASAKLLGTDTLKTKIDEGNAKLGRAAAQLAETGAFADVKEFGGSAAEVQESMVSLNTDLTAWNKEYSERQANQEWAKNLNKRTAKPPANDDNGHNRPTPEELGEGSVTGRSEAPFYASVNQMWRRLGTVAESTGLDKDGLFNAIRNIKFNSDYNFGDEGVGQSISNAAFGTPSWTPESTRTGRVPMLPRHDPILPRLLPVVTWSQAAYPYVQEKTAFVGTGKSGALESRGDADRDEGAKGPEATMTMELVTEPITSKAFSMPVHSEVLEDVPGSRNHVTMRMPQLMEDILNNNLLNGERQPNATKGIVGFLNRTGTRSATFADEALSAPTTDKTLALLVAIHLAIVNQVGNAAAYPDYALFNLQMYHQILTAQDKEGRFLFGGPTAQGMRSIWGVPFTFHPNMPVNANGAKVGLMGAFRSHSAYISRKGMTLAFTDSNDDEFEKLIGRFRVDVRHGLALYRPAAFTVLSAGGTF